MRRVVPIQPSADPSVANPEAFGRALRVARTAAGMTLVDAAAVLEVSKQTLSDLERGRGTVGLGIALKAARDLGVSLFAVPSSDREPVRRTIMNMRGER